MARKKRKDEETEEKYEWVPPEFDEKAFLKKDMVGTKALLYTTLVAFLFGGLSAAVGNYVSSIVGFIVYLAGVIFLNYSFKYARIKTEDVDKKTTIGNIALYMLLALGVWIFLINPPFF
ncbi:MAG: hypothetical protein SA339_02920 [Methanomassiliicoccus sp.]|nr:hypothetical protein [Methanomassiliicoccus sp.]